MRDFNDYRDVSEQKARRRRTAWTVTAVIAVVLVVAVVGLAVVIPMMGQNRGDETLPTSTTTPALSEPDGNAQANISVKNPVVDIAKAIGPSVVGVTSTRKITPDSGVFGGDMRESQYAGSGFVVTEKGHIVTNQHVVEGGTAFTVLLPGGKELSARLIGQDATTDLAVLQVQGQTLPVAPLGDSSKVQVGELAVAIGNPLGNELAGTVTTGIISATQRKMRVGSTFMNLLQTDAAINPGNSGGPLVDSKGQVIGINTQKTAVAGVDEYGRTISAEGIGFAIPINEARPIINELIEKGRVTRAGIGISCYEIDRKTAEAYDVPQGIYVDDANIMGSAYRAGVRAGDIITKLDNKPVVDLEDFTQRLLKKKIGDKTTITLWRNGTEVTLVVTIMDISNLQ
ncbi:MAG: S1C family serine protease [Christensenellales bacterium]|jgi:serine protease Do